ncbi:MAG: nucleoside deaminase [Neisseriales bacterium]|nr:MAG: nucleoside deaminase [Neisseriales bacterium]
MSCKKNSVVKIAPPSKQDIAFFMDAAYQLACQAEAMGEVPVGAVVVKNQRIIGQGYNTPISRNSPFAHAEIIALQNAAILLHNYRLVDCDMYTTLEPCLMCAGAITQARIRRLIFGTYEPKCGVAGSVIDIFANPQLNVHTSVFGNVDTARCTKQLVQFFQKKRKMITKADPAIIGL